jgi:hypothetical protein
MRLHLCSRKHVPYDHGVELLDILSTGDYEAQHKGNNVVLGSFLFLIIFVAICHLLNWLMSF